MYGSTRAVMARWRGYKTWFSAVVRKVYKDKHVNRDQVLLDLKYDDGEVEVSLSLALSPLCPPSQMDWHLLHRCWTFHCAWALLESYHKCMFSFAILDRKACCGNSWCPTKRKQTTQTKRACSKCE